MNNTELNNILGTMDAMKYIESALYEFYDLCSKRWPADSFWSNISDDEKQHSLNIDKLKSIISEDPASFEVGKIFTQKAILLILEGIKINIEKLKRWEIKRDQALYIAYDYENSVIERNYMNIIITKKLNYTNIMSNIVQQTYNHRKRFEEEILKLKWTKK